MEKNIMTTTGITKRMDDLGRVLIPKEVRRAIGVVEGEALEIFTDGYGSILLCKEGTTKLVPNPEAKPEPEKITYTFKDDYYDDSYRVVTITREQEKLLNWLCDNGYLGNDVSFDVGYPNGEDLTK